MILEKIVELDLYLDIKEVDEDGYPVFDKDNKEYILESVAEVLKDYISTPTEDNDDYEPYDYLDETSEEVLWETLE